MNDLYLIGNGFDLAHGLKTSYNDFLLWYLKESIQFTNSNHYFKDDLIEINGNASWLMRGDYSSIRNILGNFSNSNLRIQYKHEFFKKIVENYRDYKWVDIEYEYYMALVALYKRLEKKDVLKHDLIDIELDNLNKCFESIKKKLEEYLTEAEGGFRKEKLNSINNVLFGDTDEGQKLVLYFNYTSTINAYISNRILKIDDIIHIHGKLDDPQNPIIFGYGDEIDPHYEKIENLNNNEFLKNIKSFGYFRTNNYQRVNSFIDGKGKEFTVKILGHSCGLSDRILLNTIFEHPNCKSIKIYYYEKSPTENDYFEKTQEISRHFKALGKSNMRTKIVPFPESVPLVPLDEKN
jgi:hypothetical protein